MMVGKMFKSKINGALFTVAGCFEDDGRMFYSVRDVANETYFVVSKDWFENGIMQNLEMMNNEKNHD